MTDITAAAPMLRHTRLLRPALPKLSLGRLIAAMSTAIGQAVGMAYVAPYQSSGRRPVSTADEDLGGRDPSW